MLYFQLAHNSTSQCVRLWIRWVKRNKKTMNHLKAGERDNSSWSGPEKVGCTPTVKSREALLLKYFLNAINDTRVTLFRVVALFLKP